MVPGKANQPVDMKDNIMFRYKIFIDNVLKEEGTEDEINFASAQLALMGDLNAPVVENKADMQAAAEGKVIGYFLDEYKNHEAFDMIEQLTQQNYVLGVGMSIAAFFDFQPRVTIEITEE